MTDRCAPYVARKHDSGSPSYQLMKIAGTLRVVDRVSMSAELAWATACSQGTYFQALVRRVTPHRGIQKASVAVAHSLLRRIFSILRDHQPYRDLGPDHFDRLDTARIERHHVRRLEQLGYAVTLTPQQAA